MQQVFSRGWFVTHHTYGGTQTGASREPMSILLPLFGFSLFPLPLGKPRQIHGRKLRGHLEAKAVMAVVQHVKLLIDIYLDTNEEDPCQHARGRVHKPARTCSFFSFQKQPKKEKRLPRKWSIA